MPVSDGKIPKVAKSARDRTLVVRLLAFREFVTDYFIGATLSATVTIIMIALAISHSWQNRTVRRSRGGVAHLSHLICARRDDDGDHKSTSSPNRKSSFRNCVARMRARGKSVGLHSPAPAGRPALMNAASNQPNPAVSRA